MAQAHTKCIEIEYETFGDSEAAPLLLIMGLGGQLIHWDEAFCSELSGRGFYVIRFDNRDAGRSTKLDALGIPTSRTSFQCEEMAERYQYPIH